MTSEFNILMNSPTVGERIYTSLDEGTNVSVSFVKTSKILFT